MIYELPKEFMDKWLVALKSGEYEQGRCQLRDSDNRYCCLGVAADICGDDLEFYGERGTLNYKSKTPLSLQGGTFQNALIHLNDTREYSFSEIANWIEENVKPI